MKAVVIAASAAALAATPAMARDGAPYVGVGVGGWFVNDIKAKAIEATGDNHVTGKLNTGIDAEVVAGYDWGAFRTEIEAAKKYAKFSEIDFGQNVPLVGTRGSKRAEGSLKATTVALNLLGDFPIGDRWYVTAGPGLGYAWLDVHPLVYGISFSSANNPNHSSKLNERTKSGLYGQLTAGIRREVTANLEVGAKYRLIRSSRETFDGGITGDIRGRIQSHSLMASILYSFGSVAPAPVAVVPAPAPMPPAPATQVCADGSVIDAAAACPVAPAAPAPAPSPGERG